jgi:hypothetical protein
LHSVLHPHGAESAVAGAPVAGARLLIVMTGTKWRRRTKTGREYRRAAKQTDLGRLTGNCGIIKGTAKKFCARSAIAAQAQKIPATSGRIPASFDREINHK